MYQFPLEKNDIIFGIRNTKYKNSIVGSKEGLIKLKNTIEKSLESIKIATLDIPTSYATKYDGIICLNDEEIERLIKEVNDKETLEKQERTITKFIGFIFPVIIAFSIGVGIYTIFNWIF